MKQGRFVRSTALVLLGLGLITIISCKKDEHPAGSDHPEKAVESAKAEHPKGEHPTK